MASLVFLPSFARSALNTTPKFGLRSAGLHTTRILSSRPTTPLSSSSAAVPEPYVKGTVNDPTPFPPPSKIHGSYHWAFERVIAASLVPIVGATFVTSPHPILDGILASTLIVHSHIGFDANLTDYLHKRKFPVLGPICTWTLRAATLAALFGIYQFNTNDIGLTELVIKSWKA